MPVRTCVPCSCGMVMSDDTPWAQADTVALQQCFMTLTEACKLTAYAVCRLAADFWQDCC